MYQIEKLQLSADTKIADVIINNPYLMLLLEHFGIEPPLQEQTVGDICAENKINTKLFLAFVSLYNGLPYNFTDSFSHHEISSIIVYLKNSHKYYSEEIYPNILRIIRQMNSSESRNEMALVEKFFDEYFAEVTEHLNYENDIVFPYIINLQEIFSGLKNPVDLTKYSVLEYKEHHNDIKEKLDDLKNLLIKYLPQKEAPSIRRKLLMSLFELEYDLNIHSQIEDSLLIPLVTKMELYLKNKK